MKNLARFSLHNRSLITLLAIVSAVFGAIALTSMRQDLVPAIASSNVSVVTTYEGATPTVVDSEVSQVIETIVESVDGLESTTTYSGTDLSLVTATFELGLDTERVMEDISKKLAENRTLLPDDVKPQVSATSVDDFPVLQFAVNPGDTQLTTTLQDSIAQRVEGVAGVREARFIGVGDDQVHVVLDEAKSTETGIGVRELQSAILSGGAVEASGSLTEGERTLNVQSGTALKNAEDIAGLPVVAPATGTTTTIGEVASVDLMVPGPPVVSRVDGDGTVVMLVSKVPNANAVELSEAVSAEMADIDSKYGLESTVIFDQSPYIQKSIETLAVEGLIGLVCAVIVVLFFLGSVRTTLVTAVSIPSSLLLAGIAMHFADFSINMITLAALTVAIGRVVDDSIVVIESIEREMLVTSDRVTAIVGGVSTVAGAVMSSTLTTVAVFLPIAYIGGTLGELFRPFALTAAAALLASLLVSLTIVPVLAYWFVRPRELSGTVTRFDERVRTRLDSGYRPALTWSLARPWRVVAFSTVVLIATAALIPGMSTGYLAPLGDTQVRVLQKLDPATSVDAQKKSADIIEDGLDGIDGIERVQTSIRSSGSVIQDASLGGGAGIASYVISTADGVDQTAMIDEVRSTLEALPEYESLGKLDYSIASDMEFSSGIEVSVTALDDESLVEAVDVVTEKIEELDSVADAESTLASTVERLDVDVDGARAIEYGLTEQEVRDAVTDAVSTTDAGSMIVGGDTIDIVVYPPTDITAASRLNDIPIATAVGERALSTFATVKRARGPVVVQSQQGLRSAVISVAARTDNLGATSDDLAAAIDDIALPDGANVSLGGSVTARIDAFQQMGVISLIAVLIVYVIMVATFRSLVQPALLLVAIPFAATGGAIIQRVSGEPIGVPSLIGCLMLVGIVVTNSIVLIDLVNQRRAAGMDLLESIVDGATRRIRPILMTAAATVFALVPMALGFTNSSAFISRPLALVVIGGLVSSTVLTLLVLPVLYYLLERWREQRRERRNDDAVAGPRRSTHEPERRSRPVASRPSSRPASVARASSPSRRRGSAAEPTRRPEPTRLAEPGHRPPRDDARTARVAAPAAEPVTSPAPARGSGRPDPRRIIAVRNGRTSSGAAGRASAAQSRRATKPTGTVASDAVGTNAPGSSNTGIDDTDIDDAVGTNAPGSDNTGIDTAAALERTTRLAPSQLPRDRAGSRTRTAAEAGTTARIRTGASTGTGAPSRATTTSRAMPLITAETPVHPAPAPSGGGLRSDRGDRSTPLITPAGTPQYVTFAQDEERTAASTVRTWWTTMSSERLPLLMLDPFTPHDAHGVGIAEPVAALEFSGKRLSADQFAMLRSLTTVLREELHGYAYFAAQLVLWEILTPIVEPELDVRVPEADADIVRREFEVLYERMLRARTDSTEPLWVVTPTAPAEPRMIVAGLR